MPDRPTDDLQTWVGLSVTDCAGTDLGTLSQIYVDERTNHPQWVAISSHESQLSHLAPVEGIRLEKDTLVLGVTRGQVEDAPWVDDAAEGYLSTGLIRELRTHYRLDGDDDDDPVAVIRSEEELRIGLQRQESERVRLRKVIVTEEVTQTFTLSHEELRVEREDLSEEAGGPVDRELSEDERTITLYAERLVVGKEVVAKERVRLVTEVVRGDETIQVPVRREEVVVEPTDQGTRNK